jgi:signal transduction histidine kinase
LSFVPTDLATLTTDLASSFRSLVERAGLQLHVDCSPLPQPVYVDPAQWEKIILNLVSNAFKFTLKGEISVTVAARSDHVEVTVKDTGTGIPARELPHIFERFRRVEGAKGRSFEGTGIGLSLVHELVRLHGGSLRASSVEGEGSTFQIALPFGSAHLPAEAVSESPSAYSPAGGGSHLIEAARWLGAGWESDPAAAPMPDALGALGAGVEAGETKRSRVLVAEGNRDMRDYLVRLLSSRWQVDAAEDGLAALDKAREQRPHLVLSDVMMPRLDGFGLLRELRNHPRTSSIPVVLLSARAGEEAIIQGLETGADDYLLKPFSARELLARVHTNLEMARVRQEWSSELERANAELEAFSYSVSHDLRAPLRAIDGFSGVLQTDYADKLDEQGQHYLARVRSATRRMGQLIDDLLSLSKITRAPVQRESVDLTAIARNVLRELARRDSERKVEALVEESLIVQGDPNLCAVLLENLLGNAWKFTSKHVRAQITLSMQQRDDEPVIVVQDNGAGFDMKYAKRLFSPFQRLHSQSQFEGTGIGLAIVQRIVSRHRGRIWAEAEVDQGATFYFTLGRES